MLGGEELVKPRTTFPAISGSKVMPYSITLSICGYASLPLRSGKEESKVFKCVVSEIIENGISVSAVLLGSWYLTYLNVSFICKIRTNITLTLQL